MHRVLLIDDEPWALKNMELAFPWEKYGFQIIGRFTRPAEAYKVMCTLQPEVVITDLRMPGMTGIDLIRQARENGVQSIFVLLSGVSDFASAQQAIRFGVVEYALKPLEEAACEALVQRLSKLLEPPESQENVTVKMLAIQDYIDANLHSKPTIQTVAEAFHISRNTLGRMFRAELNTTFGQYLEQRRMDCALRMLKKTKLSVGEIADQLGYGDQNYFAVCFKRKFSLTPTQYRARGGDRYSETKASEHFLAVADHPGGCNDLADGSCHQQADAVSPEPAQP